MYQTEKNDLSVIKTTANYLDFPHEMSNGGIGIGRIHIPETGFYDLICEDKNYGTVLIIKE